jgi:hydrogenase maturation protease
VTSVLVIGYGNPGRLDDGLGPLFADELEKMNLPDVAVDSNYQLAVEDADSIAKRDVVIFVDADVSGREPFWFGKVTPRQENSFSSHSISPEAVLHMANNMLGGHAMGYILGIRGYEFNEFGERLSKKASDNLKASLLFLKEVLIKKSFDNYIIMTNNKMENKL